VKKMTPEQFVEKLKQDPMYETRQELGRMCLIQKEFFTEEQNQRYEFLLSKLKDNV